MKVNVFITWSKPRSQCIAAGLKRWLKLVMNNLEPFVSFEDIDRGSRWDSEIAIKLEEADVGIACVTAENLREPWLLFEAGAIAKKVKDKALLIPYVYGMPKESIGEPLSRFQAVEANKEGTFKMMETMNKRLGTDALSESMLEESFDMWWPKLETELIKVPPPTTQPPPRPGIDELLEQLFAEVRSQGEKLTKLAAKEENFYTLKFDPARVNLGLGSYLVGSEGLMSGALSDARTNVLEGPDRLIKSMTHPDDPSPLGSAEDKTSGSKRRGR